MKILRDASIEVVEQTFPRDAVYIADEAFMTGTAAEITPIAKVDNVPVGEGRRGPITKAIQDAYFGVLRGEPFKEVLGCR